MKYPCNVQCSTVPGIVLLCKYLNRIKNQRACAIRMACVALEYATLERATYYIYGWNVDLNH